MCYLTHNTPMHQFSSFGHTTKCQKLTKCVKCAGQHETKLPFNVTLAHSCVAIYTRRGTTSQTECFKHFEKEMDFEVAATTILTVKSKTLVVGVYMINNVAR